MTSTDDQPCGCAAIYHENGVHAPGHPSFALQLSVPPGAYPVEDVVAMSPSSVALLLHRAKVDSEFQNVVCRHLVIIRYVDTDTVTYSGPYPTGLEALTFAQRFIEHNRSSDPRRRFTLRVEPMLSH